MRAALSTIQQTLTPEAARVLNHSIAEAGCRGHGQTTPLHVAATLLASPLGFLRQACIRSHPNSSHPLQCRALELCFSVALDRLPTVAQNALSPAGMEPPISNALLAALKRAQANQRRGCPEQQQQPLLAVKVELEQLIISILDDPSISRVMREASFSSPAVKATIEHSLNSSNPHSHHQQQVTSSNVNLASNFGGIGARPLPKPGPPPLAANRNMYLNPRLQQGATPQIGNHHKGEEVNKLLEIMGRSKKRNPILVGEAEPEAVVKEFLRKIENEELGSEGVLKNAHVLSKEKWRLSDTNQISTKMDELGRLIERQIRKGGVILDLGDLQWRVEQPVTSEMERIVVTEMAKLVARFGANEGNKLWLIGTATCETYLRCQVYHSSMESDWELQAMPLPSRLPLPGMFPRLGAERFLSNPMESIHQLTAIPSPRLPALTRHVSENLDPAQRITLCPKCSENYGKELAKLAAIEKSFSDAKQESIQPSLPQWMQSAKLSNTEGKSRGQLSKSKTQELQKKWQDTCLHLHPNLRQNTCTDRTGPPVLSIPSLYNPNLLLHPPFQPKLHVSKPLGEALKLNINPVTISQHSNSPPGSPVRTDLVLGLKEAESIPEKPTGDQAKDFLGCISSEPLLEKFSNAVDADTYKKLLKGLMGKAWWQAEAASAVASAVTRCRLGNGKYRGGAGSRGDIWLLFTGPDRVGKKKMAFVLAEQTYGASPIMICLGKRREDGEAEMNFRGKTAIDRIAEAVRRNPFPVIMLEDIDEADLLLQGSINRMIERGRLTDSHGREVGLGNAMFIVTGDWSMINHDSLRDVHFVDEKKLASIAGGFQLGLIVREKNAKRRVDWIQDGCRKLKPRMEIGLGLSLDLNLAYSKDDKTDGSHNSSNLAIEQEDELGFIGCGHFSIASVPHKLVSNFDDVIPFKPVELTFVQREIKKTISTKFSMTVEENLAIEVEDDVLDKIIGGLWHDRANLEEWIDKVLLPSFNRLKTRLPSGDRNTLVVRLVVESGFGCQAKSDDSLDWLPSSILV